MDKEGVPTLTQLQASTSAQSVNVYLRNSKKEAKLVPFRSPASSSDLVVIASIRFNIPAKRVILFYNGFRIDNYSLPINLVEKGIIHILDTRNIQLQNIVIHFRPVGWNIPLLKLQVTTDMTVQYVIDNFLIPIPQYGLDSNRYFIVYIGKILNHSNTIREELIENGAELTLVEHKVTKESYQFHTSQHVRPLLQSTVRINMPVTFNTSVLSLKKKNQEQASLIQQQNHNLQLSNAAALQDSFFNGNIQKSDSANAPGEKKESKLQSSDKERSSGSSGQKNKFKGQADCAPDQKLKGTLLLQTIKHGLEHSASPFPFPLDQQNEESEDDKKKEQKSSF